MSSNCIKLLCISITSLINLHILIKSIYNKAQISSLNFSGSVTLTLLSHNVNYNYEFIVDFLILRTISVICLISDCNLYISGNEVINTFICKYWTNYRMTIRSNGHWNLLKKYPKKDSGTSTQKNSQVTNWSNKFGPVVRSLKKERLVWKQVRQLIPPVRLILSI